VLLLRILYKQTTAAMSSQPLLSAAPGESRTHIILNREKPAIATELGGQQIA
jgi:hypothetical protein